MCISIFFLLSVLIDKFDFHFNRFDGYPAEIRCFISDFQSIPHAVFLFCFSSWFGVVFLSPDSSSFFSPWREVIESAAAAVIESFSLMFCFPVPVV